MKNILKRIIAIALALLMLPWGTMVTGVNATNEQGDFTDAMPETEKDRRAYSYLSSLVADGYLSEIINANIETWQLNALADNPGIIEKIWDHASGTSAELAGLINDGWNMMGNGLVALTVKENHTAFGTAVKWTNKAAGAYMDLDLAFGRQAGTQRDWRGFEYLWFYIDVSLYGNSEVPLGIAFEEYDVVDGQISADRESWALTKGSTVRLYPDRGDAQDAVIGTSTTNGNVNNGRVILPADFKGWIRIPLNETNFFRYWEYPSANGKLDLADVHQFNLCLESTADSAGGEAYLGPFMLSGKTDEVPTTATKANYTNIWNLNGVKDTQQNDPNAWMVEAAWAWYNEYPGKLLTGVSYSYRLSPSKELKEAGDKLVSELKRVQESTGYLGIFDGAQRMGGGGANWDVWGHYHIIYGLYQWHRATGNEDALTVAAKAADYVIKHFASQRTSYVAAGTAQTNMAIGHAFAVLYLETGEQKYLDEAIKIVDTCWKDPMAGNWLEAALAGKDFYQMVGTSNPYTNRWEALHPLMTLAVLYEITGEERYFTGLENLWTSIQKTDRHNSGSFSVGEGACGDPFQIGGIETCCSVAWLGLTTEYLQVSRNSIAADELELGYYNTMMASLLEGGKYVTYDTQMNGSLIPATQQLAFQARANSPDFSCCQANAARGIGELSQWAVLTDNTGLYWNFYGSAHITTQTPGGQTVCAQQTTIYPEDGKIHIEISGLKQEEQFTVWFRVPSWASAYKVTIGDQSFMAENTGEYLPITGTWRNGTTVDIEIGMTFHFWKGENQCNGYTSVYYGPVLLAADTKYANLTAKINIEDLVNAKIYRKDNMLLTVDAVDNRGNTVTLISFADVGNDGSSYRSWLRTEGTIDQVKYEKNGTPVWCSNLIPVGEPILPDTPDVPVATEPSAPGTPVATEPSVPGATEGTAEPTVPGQTQATEPDATEQTNGAGEPGDQQNDSNGWILPAAIGTATACAAVVAGVVVKKGKKKDGK
ncbi:MAG: hypothetical protein E7436_02950 [Ruminococcaceae bacterium]|nr:hypothetical protein [Oscillospiraceae bacterium]